MRPAELVCDEKTRNDGNEVPHGERTYEDVDAVMNEVNRGGTSRTPRRALIAYPGECSPGPGQFFRR
jgi:hypothetical protein